MRFSIVVAAATLVSACSAAPTSGNTNHVLHEKRNGKPHQWGKRDRASAHEVLPIRIGLRQRNLENADRYMYDVSDPNSPNFGKHWSSEQIANTFAPSLETKDGVTKWLTESGIDRARITFSKGTNWVEFDGTVEEAERLFNTEYWYYQHHESGGYRLACDSYSLPQHVQEHVDFAMPTIQLDGLRPVANVRSHLAVKVAGGANLVSKTCKELITIDCLRSLYQFPAGSSASPSNEMGIAEWADYLVEEDLPIYFQNFTSPEIPSDTRPDFISIDGGKRANATTQTTPDQYVGVESALDFQTAYSIIHPQKLRLYQLGDSVNVDSVGTFNIFLDALDASYCTYQGGDQPYVDPEYPDYNEGGYTGPLHAAIEGALPVFYQQRQCLEWMKLGLQGVSVLFASGDAGVANVYNSGYPDSCLNAKNGYVDTNGTRFSPSFPANCPYITSVGGTTLLNGTVASGERAVDKFASGGGFSDVFEMPSYQASAVKNYLSKHAPSYGANVYNNSGNARGFPDVAAIGYNVATVFNNSAFGVGGTSASCPIVAGIVTLLNEERLKAGKGPIGFLNPTFYANPDAFNDITIGNNPGCGTDGFKAAPGWDPVTGLGTPNYPKLKELFLSLP